MGWIPAEDADRSAGTSSISQVHRIQNIGRSESVPEQRRAFLKVLDWPYVEGLRMDEATHPLALIATGIYGKPLPNQNGAPLRLVVPWKYGFKGIKAIVNIRFTDKQPVNTWQQQAS